MRRDVASGILLIGGSLACVVVMSLHPRPHDLMGGSAARQAHLNVMVHGMALAAVPMLFLGLLGLSRRLGSSDLTIAALVVYGFGSVAVLAAAVASGFVATGVIEQVLDAEGTSTSRKVYHALLTYTGLLNQGFAKVNVVAWAVAILLWSAAILKSGRMSRPAGAVGAVVGTGVLLAFFSGHLRLDVHGFGMVTFAQSAWMIWVGILLCYEGGEREQAPR